MAKYHWGRITGNPELNRELMVTLEAEEDDEDMPWAQLPDVCSKDALQFRNAGPLLYLEGYAPSQPGNWSIILLVGKYLYAGDICIGDDAGPFDSLDQALACAPKFDSILTAGSNFVVRSELPFHQTLEILAKHLPEGACVNVNLKPLIMARGSLRPDANYLGQRIIDLLQSEGPLTPAENAELNQLFPPESTSGSRITVDFSSLLLTDPKLSELLKADGRLDDSGYRALISRNDPAEIWAKTCPDRPLWIMIGGPEELGGTEMGVYKWGDHYFACTQDIPLNLQGPFPTITAAIESSELLPEGYMPPQGDFSAEVYTDLPENELVSLLAKMGTTGTTIGVYSASAEGAEATGYYKSESGYVRD